ncbi:unnamed protein product [Tuber aestivum]|uniref:Uncharacterized protein n=1 Tax=Tuber aestivum TaxID=59557 RepID=A0A292PYN7_9PEZI|nr:unnamed protein product [Tuber aestivum]
MPESLFGNSTTSWNVAKLENLLDCLGKKLQCVNTASLYLGMWISTTSIIYTSERLSNGTPSQERINPKLSK